MVKDAPSVVIVGQGALREADGSAVLGAAMQLAAETNSKLWFCTRLRTRWCDGC